LRNTWAPELSIAARRKLWLLGSGAQTLLKDNPGYYESLLELVPSYPNPNFYQIELDLHRTFSTNENLDHHTKSNRDILRRVLTAYIKRNPTVGYWQGMNFIVAVLITQFSEEEVFWILCQIIETILPLDYFSIMTGVKVDQKCFETLIRSHLPKVYEHMIENNFQMESFNTNWFLWIFSNTLELGLTVDGQVSFGINKFFRSRILESWV
jgi:hypothetical protein